ncbi:MAG: SBBP repeat-containing protein [bacterium]|nr:SBBP repeat-containing protein [bacterium]
MVIFTSINIYFLVFMGSLRPVSALDSGIGLVWSTYLGGMDNTPTGDQAQGVAIDNEGNVYITGATSSINWVSGGYDTSYDGGGDIWYDGFLAKFSPLGQHLWSTYLGGNSEDNTWSVAVDADGYVYVTGMTKSEGWISGGFDTSLDTSHGVDPITGEYTSDVYVMKLSGDGVPVWSTYVGGSGAELAESIALDKTGCIYVAGFTTSSDWISGGYDVEYGGGEGFVAKLTSDGNFLWSTYIGGDNGDQCYGISVDSSGNVLVCGLTNSTGWVSGGYNIDFNGSTSNPDGFVVKLSPEGSHLWSTYLGGNEREYVRGIAIDHENNIYVTGETYSPDWIAGGFDTLYPGHREGYLLKLSSSGQALWSTYLGGLSTWSDTCAVDDAGNVYVAGTSEISGWIPGDLGNGNGGNKNAFLARIAADGSRLLWSYGVGGVDADNAFGLALDNTGDIYLGGGTLSPDWVNRSWDSTFAGRVDAFLLKFIDKAGSLQVAITPPAAVAGGARWRRVGTGAWRESGEVEEFIPAGGCAVEFNDLTGWVKPANQMVSIAKDTTATLSVSYALDVGSLSVTIEPAQAAAGARWRRVGTTTWLDSGGTEAGVPSGDWFVEFNDVAGWDKPVARDCTVKFNQTTRLTVYYAPSALNAADPRVWNLYQ